MQLFIRPRLALALSALVFTAACGNVVRTTLPYPAVQSSSLLTQYVYALRAAEQRQIAYPDEPLWLRDEGGRSVDTSLNADNAAMVFYALANGGQGNERIANEILKTLPPMLQRYEEAYEKSQGKWYQDEYVETIGVQLAMLSLLPAKLANAGQIEKANQAASKSSLIAKADAMAKSEQLKAPTRERLQLLVRRYG
ncbi:MULTISPECIES: hypothetical protein [Variovorax]|jgi:hypothetical protein|uniref:hypothetical protein n=1 Tax=Variovorax TaxID=34072 RepID=UPI00086E4612|nr:MULTISPECIES: hypothetical protein [Variovorax]MBN8758634.1 hypothetical protein [Variovorax sp.]ODU14194.1 MAG: hypothetical protein ABS94_23135 [Variovorax sp. SCN 67-85]ODV25653.1 MAG: hypothetical protein ABT25_09745 [Variovorax sp. SCN 67-20]OJZ08705.1 MAG: hypothetical protein BGP22_32605 [Variovorax sp. 67-131]UKI11091.1 hypothetical protein L3V85_14945 [Variovorax paradoxus]